MNIKPEIEQWNQKLETSLKTLYSKKKIISKIYTDNILSLQKMLENYLEKINHKNIFSIDKVESYFCYSNFNSVKSDSNFISSFVDSIPLKIDKNLNYDKLYFQNLQLNIQNYESIIQSILDTPDLSILIFRHLKLENTFYTPITVESLAKFFLLNLNPETNISGGLISSLYQSLTSPENLEMLKIANQKILNSHKYFYHQPSNFFFNFELYQEIYSKSILLEKRLELEIQKEFQMLKSRLDKYLPQIDNWEQENINQIEAYLENKKNTKFYNDTIVKKIFKIYTKINDLHKNQNKNVAKKTKLEQDNNILKKKMQTTYDPGLNLKRRFHKIQNVTSTVNPVSHNDKNISQIFQDSIDKIIEDNDKSILHLNFELFQNMQIIKKHQENIDKYQEKLEKDEKLFHFKYQNDINSLQLKTQKLNSKNLYLEQIIKEKKDLKHKYDILQNSYHLDKETLLETQMFRENKLRNELGNLNNSHQVSFEKFKKYKYFYQLNLNELDRIEKDKNESLMTITNLEKEILILQNKFVKENQNQNKLDEVLEIFKIDCHFQNLKKLETEFQINKTNRSNLELLKNPVNLRQCSVPNIKEFILKEVSETYFQINFVLEDRNYKIDLLNILNHMVLYQNLNLTLQIWRGKIDEFLDLKDLLNMKKLENTIFKREIKFNPIFIDLKKKELEMRKKQHKELLESIFKENSFLFSQYTQNHRKLYHINCMIKTMSSKNRKLKTLHNIILNN